MSILDHAPTFSLEDASQLAQSSIQPQATARPLPSERDQNFPPANGEWRTLRAQDRQRGS